MQLDSIIGPATGLFNAVGVDAAAAAVESPTMSTPILAAIAAALFLTIGGGLLTPVGEWYRTLRKPAWNPPNWVFGPAWTIILGLWAWAGVLAWRGAIDDGGRTAVLTLFGVNAVCHFLWSPLFFKLRRPDWALVEVVFLWASLVALLVGLRQFSVLASWLIVPYFVWVSFAACLNGVIVRLNRPFGRAS